MAIVPKERPVLEMNEPIDLRREANVLNPQDDPSSYLLSLNLHHVVLQICRLNKSTHDLTKSPYIVGTYVRLPAAEAAAQTCLSDAGYDNDSFSFSIINSEPLQEGDCIESGANLRILAVTHNGIEFQVRVCTTPNIRALTGNCSTGLIDQNLWHVLYTKLECIDHEKKRKTIKGTFRTFRDAKDYAWTILLPQGNCMAKQRYLHYEELEVDEQDCNHEEKVVTYAFGHDASCFIVSILREYRPEEARWAYVTRQSC